MANSRNYNLKYREIGVNLPLSFLQNSTMSKQSELRPEVLIIGVEFTRCVVTNVTTPGFGF